MADDIRRGRYWLLAAQLATVAPQWDRLPWWLSLLMLAACVWRLPTVELRFRPPGFWPRLLILAAGLAGLFQSYRTVLGPEAGSAFLILCMALKLLEMRNLRDCYVAVILGFFVVATNFLFSQSLLLTAYVGLTLLLIVAALLALNQAPGTGHATVFRRALVLLGQAVPLMLILFLFFPRLPPLWTINLSQGSARTGMSDSMSPGDIARLGQSDELAFRVEFHGEPPPKAELYWRALVLSHFDGKTWTADPEVSERFPPAWNRNSPPRWLQDSRISESGALTYRIILEPSDQPWLVALSLPRIALRTAGLGREFTALNDSPVFSRISYEATSYRHAVLDAELSPWLRSRYLTLPAGGNARVRGLVQQWRRQYPDDRDLLRHALRFFNEQPFHYTLEPPRLGSDRIDGFLFDTRRGFCEHYASSFVFLMRAAGIPARVVVGYQGGEKSPYGDYWQVKQMDAHAWSEVWLPGEGWVQFDPTAMVAPERIERGMGALTASREFWGESGASVLRYGNHRLLSGLRQWADYINYRWYADVLGYDSNHQDNLMLRLLGDASLMKRLLLMVGLFVLGLALIAGWMLWQRPSRRLLPEERHYRRYCRRMAGAGLPRAEGEGVTDYAERIARERPPLAASAREVASLYVLLQYRPAGREQEAMRQRLRRLSWTARTRG